jgi:hypothetical protein
VFFTQQAHLLLSFLIEQLLQLSLAFQDFSIDSMTNVDARRPQIFQQCPRPSLFIYFKGKQTITRIRIFSMARHEQVQIKLIVLIDSF